MSSPLSVDGREHRRRRSEWFRTLPVPHQPYLDTRTIQSNPHSLDSTNNTSIIIILIEFYCFAIIRFSIHLHLDELTLSLAHPLSLIVVMLSHVKQSHDMMMASHPPTLISIMKEQEGRRAPLITSRVPLPAPTLA